MSDPARETDAARLLDAALRQVPFEGMNDAALTAAARELGLAPAYARMLLPGGGAGLAAAYHRRADRALGESLAATPPQGPFRDQVAEAVMRRLGLVDPEIVRTGAAVLALPGNAGLGLRLIGETADTIWRALGDESDDLSWWTRRASLAAVIAPTVIYWLSDGSAGSADTRRFLDRRIKAVMRVEGVKKGLRRLPGWQRLARTTTGWVRAPASAHESPRARG